MLKCINDKIEALNKQFQELGIDYKFDTRSKIPAFVLIHEEGCDIGDTVYGVFESREEAEDIGEKRLYRWRVEDYILRIEK